MAVTERLLRTFLRKPTETSGTPFDYCHPHKINKFETIPLDPPMTFRNVITKLEESALDGKRLSDEERFLRASVLPYELLRVVNDWKIRYSQSRNYDYLQHALVGQGLIIDYSFLACEKDNTPETRVLKSQKLWILRSLLESGPISKILDETIVEAPDPGIMPNDPVAFINSMAEKIKNDANGEEIVAHIGLDRPYRLGLAITKRYLSQNNLDLNLDVGNFFANNKGPIPGSYISAERCSLTRNPVDNKPQIDPVYEAEKIKRMSRGKHAVVITTSDRVDRVRNYLGRMGYLDQKLLVSGLTVISIPTQDARLHARTDLDRQVFEATYGKSRS
jgi:hypothetical protein